MCYDMEPQGSAHDTFHVLYDVSRENQNLNPVKTVIFLKTKLKANKQKLKQRTPKNPNLHITTTTLSDKISQVLRT